MKEILLQLNWSAPQYLFLFALLPIFWFMRGRVRSLPVLFWRSLILTLLILALANPQKVSQATKREERIFAFDLSQSIPGDMRRWMKQVVSPDVTPSGQDRFFVFAGEAREVKDWERWLVGEVPLQSIRPGETNLESLFSAVSSGPSATRKVLLFTDGWENHGSLDRILSSSAVSALQVFPMLPPVSPEVANVAVRRVLLPHQGLKGERVTVKVLLENQSHSVVQGLLVLERDGETIRRDTLKLDPGHHLYSWQVPLSIPGLISVTASFVPRGEDLFPQDNRAAAWISVSAKERVLLVNGEKDEGRYLEEILERRGFEVSSLGPADSLPPPQGYGIVVFNNVKRERFSPGYLEAVKQGVAAGGGFLMLGGERSFGLGGYRRSPVEEVLPVSLLEPKKEEKRRAFVLVVDKSGSMREESKLLYAKEAAKAVANQLQEQDLLGVVGFDISPFVVIPLTPAETIRRGGVHEIERLKAGGKTYLFPAMIEAKRQLERHPAERKHMIILSDGETGGTGSDYIDLVSVMRAELKITVSAVAIGDRANIPLLSRIASYGGGLFHHTYDPTTLPRIVLQDVTDQPKEESLVEREFTPVPRRGSELLGELAGKGYPRIQGFVETELKREASEDLIIRKQEKTFPLLASWLYRQGKAVSFAADFHGRWTKEWVRWEPVETFWDGIFEWLTPLTERPPAHEVRISLAGNGPVLDLYVYGEESDRSLFRFSYEGNGDKGSGLLERRASGYYRAELPFSSPGDYRIQIVEERGGRSLSYPTLGATLAYDPKIESPKPRFHYELLENLARKTGGKINPAAERDLRSEAAEYFYSPLRYYFMLAAGLLFLLEIFYRKLVLKEAS